MSAPGCRIVRRHMDACVDGELDSTTQVELDAHMSGCPICREHFLFARSVKTATKRALSGVTAPDALRLRVLTALASAPAPASRAPVVIRDRMMRDRMPRAALYAVPAAAAVVLVALGTGSDELAATSPNATIVPLVEDVVRRHSSEHPPEFAGSPTQVAGWFRGRVAFPVHPVELSARDSRLVGARLSNVRERDAAAFYYDVGGHRLTVMVFEPPPSRYEGTVETRVEGRDLHYRTVHGYTVPLVDHDGLTYAFTGELDSRSMMHLAATARVSN